MLIRRHQVNLCKLMAECEANYARLCRLMPDFDTADSWDFGVPGARGATLEVRLHVIERSKYTTTVSVAQQPASAAWPALSMTVRLYHDARMAEIIGFQRRRHFKQHYDYPNKDMYQRDEKLQLNCFLGEWLAHCLRFGQSLQEVAFASGA